ncbi:MAG: helix-turn-helix transcriptional regulator, partial [Synergistaceae bacterium]|nr:helix-turn-helix transcriptional regulator [Synergistaceae bacterium]
MEFMRALRKRAGLTQSELAHRAGIGVNTIARYERGELNPSMKNVVAIAAALGVSEDALLNGPAPEEWTLEVKLGE